MDNPATNRPPEIDLPDGKRIKAFRAVEEILREDATLKRVVRSWSTWNGSGGDTLPQTLVMMPMIRLRPRVERNREFTQAQRTAAMGVSVQLLTAGVHANDIVNLWDAVEDALVGMKPFRHVNVSCYLQQQCGAVHHEVREPGFNAWQTRGADPGKCLVGEGLVLVSFLRPR